MENTQKRQIVDKQGFLSRSTEYRSDRAIQSERQIIAQQYEETKKQNRFMRMFCPVNVKVVNVHNDGDGNVNINL